MPARSILPSTIIFSLLRTSFAGLKPQALLPTLNRLKGRQPGMTSFSSSAPAATAPLGPVAATSLNTPFTADEVLAAILSAPHSSAPGLSGLPYEFYQQNSSLVTADLAAAFNTTWDKGRLPHSNLFKSNKPGADPSTLTSFTLCDTDYQLLAWKLVCQLNPPLQTCILPQQT
ncbi:hypothetical protein JCM5296_001470 [Sporobolomyces johnsonii]